MVRDIFNRANPTQHEIQGRGAAAVTNMAKLHPELFRKSIVERICRRSRFEELLAPFQADEKLTLWDPKLRPLITLASMLPKPALRSLRLVSQTTKKAMTLLMPKIFEEIHIWHDVNSDQLGKSIDALQNVGSYCRELTITLGSTAQSAHGESAKSLPTAPTDSIASSENLENSTRTEIQSPRLHLHTADVDPVSQVNASHWTQHEPRSLLLHRNSDVTSRIHPAFRGDLQSEQSPISPELFGEVSSWTYLFRFMPNFITLTIALPDGDTSWHALGPVERTLVSLRNALEKSCGDRSLQTINRLHTLRLAPTSAISIIPMRWAGLAALSTTGYSEWWTSILWSTLRVLEIQVHSPYRAFSACESRMFGKILHDYLFSFSNTLRVLRFVWLGGVGPNPMLLDLEAQLRPEKPGHRSFTDFSAPAIVWRELKEVWFGGIPVGPFTAAVMASRAETLERIVVLHEKHWLDLEPGQIWDLEDPNGWYDVFGECDGVGANEAAALAEIEKYGKSGHEECVRTEVAKDDEGEEGGSGSETEDWETGVGDGYSMVSYDSSSAFHPCSFYAV